MKFSQQRSLVISLIAIMLVAGSGCSVSKKKMKTLGAIIAVGIAAKLIYDMIIDYKSEKTSNENQIVDKYKKVHKDLPTEAQLVAYSSSLRPGDVVNAGNQISIQSQLEVVRGKDSRNVDIKEKITIYDNEDSSKELKSLVKDVNQDNKTCGAFRNEFTFTLPKGMPQGIYPIKTTVIVNGREFNAVENHMQLVLSNDHEQKPYRLAKLSH